MSNRRLDDALAASQRLREAILATRASDAWWRDQVGVFDIAQASVARWALDVGTTFREFDDALSAADASPDRDEAPGHDPVAELEDALIRAVAVRDRLRAAAALVFGARCLKPSRPGVRFEPSESDLRRRLSEMAAGGAQRAGRVKSSFEQIAEHPAMDMRNAVIHSLGPFPELVEVCWIQKAHLDEGGGIRAWESGPLYPRGSLDQGDAKPWTLFGWARDTADDAYGLLVKLTDDLASLIEDVGVMEPPPSVFVQPDGTAVLDRPESGPSKPS